jgi:hypothetical protein
MYERKTDQRFNNFDSGSSGRHGGRAFDKRGYDCPMTGRDAPFPTARELMQKGMSAKEADRYIKMLPAQQTRAQSESLRQEAPATAGRFGGRSSGKAGGRDGVNDLASDPPVSQAQRAAMHAAAAGNSTIGIPKSVGKEFANADPGGKLPAPAAKDAGRSWDLDYVDTREPLDLSDPNTPLGKVPKGVVAKNEHDKAWWQRNPTGKATEIRDTKQRTKPAA